MTDTLYPAKYTVFWPGQTVHVCDQHLDGIKGLSQAMGMPVPDMRKEAGNECENCKNEADK